MGIMIKSSAALNVKPRVLVRLTWGRLLGDDLLC